LDILKLPDYYGGIAVYRRIHGLRLSDAKPAPSKFFEFSHYERLAAP
jgi:hypothetical protein